MDSTWSVEAKLDWFRRQRFQRQAEDFKRRYGVLPVVGGAPTLPTTLATLRAASTKNTFTGPATLLSDDARGPFSTDWFNVAGSVFEQEAMGVLSVASATTPTFSFSTQYATTLGGTYTSLCSNTATASGSGVTNVNWYYLMAGVVRAAAGASSTILATGMLSWDIATVGTITELWVRNANPPTAVTVDTSTGAAFLDLQGTWSASNVNNTVTTNFYRLTNLMN
jgi:hypothetical protein